MAVMIKCNVILNEETKIQNHLYYIVLSLQNDYQKRYSKINTMLIL
jgi:hypothetical protein